MQKIILLVFVFSLPIFLPGCLYYSQQAGSEDAPATPGACFENNECVSIEIADSPEERAKGLMNRSFLAPSAGMLFAFEQSAPHSFWMKNTLIPLDVIWLDEKFSVVDVKTMVACKSEPCPLYAPKTNAKYALEVNAGVAERSGVTEGSWLIVEGID